MEGIILVIFCLIIGMLGLGLIIFGFVGFFINRRLKKKGRAGGK